MHVKKNIPNIGLINKHVIKEAKQDITCYSLTKVLITNFLKLSNTWEFPWQVDVSTSFQDSTYSSYIKSATVIWWKISKWWLVREKSILQPRQRESDCIKRDITILNSPLAGNQCKALTQRELTELEEIQDAAATDFSPLSLAYYKLSQSCFHGAKSPIYIPRGNIFFQVIKNV